MDTNNLIAWGAALPWVTLIILLEPLYKTYRTPINWLGFISASVWLGIYSTSLLWLLGNMVFAMIIGFIYATVMGSVQGLFIGLRRHL